MSPPTILEPGRERGQSLSTEIEFRERNRWDRSAGNLSPGRNRGQDNEVTRFLVPLDARQNALYNAVTMLIPDRNVLRCQAKLCGPVCQSYNAL
ncbi:hypothetical protein ANTPLA_LOCUS9042 [Anthophora plagiata]